MRLTLLLWLCIYNVMLCAIWYHLYNLKNVLLLVKLQVEASNFTKSSTPPWMCFTFFKLYKWYQIAQRTTHINFREKTSNKTKWTVSKNDTWYILEFHCGKIVWRVLSWNCNYQLRNMCSTKFNGRMCGENDFVLVNNPKQPLHAWNYFYNKIFWKRIIKNL